MKFSIIVPVFNSEDFLVRCLESVVNQDYQDFELLLVNDGSVDKSLSICDEYAMRYSNIKVFTGENKGVSVARNIGLNNAIGDWVIFLDSDDQLYEGSLLKINTLLDSNYDFIISRSYLFNGKNLIEERYPFTSSYLNKTFDGIELVLKYNYKHGSAYACIFNRKFLSDHDIMFPENIKNGEDSIFTTLAHIYAKRVRFVDVDFYRVIEREGSASRSWTLERVLHMSNNLIFLNKYLTTNNNINDKQRVLINYNSFGVATKMLDGIFSLLTFNNYLKVRRAIKQNINYPIFIGSENRYKNHIYIFNFSIDVYAIILFFAEFIKKKRR